MGLITVVNNTVSSLYVAVQVGDCNRSEVGGFSSIGPKNSETWNRTLDVPVLVAGSQKVGEPVQVHHREILKVLGGKQGEVVLRALVQSLGNELVPLRKTTEEFLSVPRTSLEYNLYLQSISHIPLRTPESTHTVRSILEHAPSHVSISTTTYSRLIRPQFSPIALLAYLHHRLTSDHSSLPLPILLSFLTAYSKLNNPDKASFFFAQITAHPHTSPDTLQHANTLLLAAQPSQQAAYHVLIKPPLPSSPSYDPTPFHSSASLHVLSKDLHVPHHTLIQSFLRLTTKPPNPSFVPLYTSLINGLILRKKYHLASDFFARLLKLLKKSSPLLKLDMPSLSAGLNALTRAGKPHLAFQLLQSHYPSLLLSPPSNPSSYHNPTLPIISFITALNRISRPDISTLLFFLYQSIYAPDAPPQNAHFLNLLLQAARMAIKMDLRIQHAKRDIPDNVKRILRYLHSCPKKNGKYPHKLGSLLSKLNLRTSSLVHRITSSLGNNLGYQHLISVPPLPFGNQSPYPHPRLYATNLILTHLGHPSRGGLRHFISSSAYQNIPTHTWARIVFLRALAGIGPNLSQVQSPAISYIPNPTLQQQQNTRPSPNLDSFTHLFLSQTHFRSSDLVPYTPSHFNDPALWQNLCRKNHEPFYPSIIPTNSNFFNYLVLLGLPSSSSSQPVTLFRDGQVSLNATITTKGCTPLPPHSPHETPLVLAWMRTLGIQPSKSTLAIALIIWGEICARADASLSIFVPPPPGERLKPGEHQYLVLVSYLREWVGESRLPHWKTLEKWRRVLARMRAGEELEEEP